MDYVQTFSTNSTLDHFVHILFTYPPFSFLLVIKTPNNDVIHAPYSPNPQKDLKPDGAPPFLFRNFFFPIDFLSGSTFFCLCFSTTMFFRQKYVFAQPVPKKGNLFNLSYRAIVLLFFLSKAFGTILERKVFKHLYTFNLGSDHQYGFCKQSSTSDLIFLADFWSFSLSSFAETFALALDMSKTADRVWYN